MKEKLIEFCKENDCYFSIVHIEGKPAISVCSNDDKQVLEAHFIDSDGVKNHNNANGFKDSKQVTMFDKILFMNNTII